MCQVYPNDGVCRTRMPFRVLIHFCSSQKTLTRMSKLESEWSTNFLLNKRWLSNRCIPFISSDNCRPNSIDSAERTNRRRILFYQTILWRMDASRFWGFARQARTEARPAERTRGTPHDLMVASAHAITIATPERGVDGMGSPMETLPKPPPPPPPPPRPLSLLKQFMIGTP